MSTEKLATRDQHARTWQQTNHGVRKFVISQLTSPNPDEYTNEDENPPGSSLLNTESKRLYHSFRAIFDKSGYPSQEDAIANIRTLYALTDLAEKNGEPKITIHHPSGKIEDLDHIAANARLIGFTAACTSEHILGRDDFQKILTSSESEYWHDLVENRGEIFALDVLRKSILLYPDNPLTQIAMGKKQLNNLDIGDNYADWFASTTSDYLKKLRNYYSGKPLPDHASFSQYHNRLMIRASHAKFDHEPSVTFPLPGQSAEEAENHTIGNYYAYLTAVELYHAAHYPDKLSNSLPEVNPGATWYEYNRARHEITQDMEYTSGWWATNTVDNTPLYMVKQTHRDLVKRAKVLADDYEQSLRNLPKPRPIDILSNLLNLNILCEGNAIRDGKSSLTINHTGGSSEILLPLEANARLLGYAEFARRIGYGTTPNVLIVAGTNPEHALRLLDPVEFNDAVVFKIISDYPDNPLSRVARGQGISSFDTVSLDSIIPRAKMVNDLITRISKHFKTKPSKEKLKKWYEGITKHYHGTLLTVASQGEDKKNNTVSYAFLSDEVATHTLTELGAFAAAAKIYSTS